ncbi:hypothetical protein G7046_g4913 [Stylonectria norvegica]|nr:hypothetical protein G7046_g4913 [Stylonectria norvegica]
MMAYKALLAMAVAKIATAHFGLEFPEWRIDTLAEENEEKYSQWTNPCAGVDYGVGNITDWPLDGGAVKLALHHPWSYIFINLGLGENTTNFNVSLTPEFLNATGNGQLCIEKLDLPEEVAEGTLGSIQVVTIGETGNALYNCADIRFTRNATGPSNCTSEMEYVGIKEQTGNGTGDASSSSSNSTNSTSGGDDSAAGALGVNKMALTSVVGLAAAFVLGLGL